MRSIAMFLFSFFLVTGFLQGQNNQATATGEYSEQSLAAVLADLESIFNVDIYYKDQNELQKPVSISFSDKTLQEVLEELLSTTTLTYIDYRDYAYVVVPRTFMDKTFGTEFYEALESSLAGDPTEEDRIVVGSIDQLDQSATVTLTGQVLDAQTEEPVIGATVMAEDANIGTTTDLGGNFQLDNLPAGKQNIRIAFIGYTDNVLKTDLRSSGALDAILDKEQVLLDEVTIRGRAADASVEQVQIGVATMDVKEIKKLPTFLGEVDVIKSFLLQPGVSTVGEGAAGFNVRGGNVDQNLILQDEAILFNSSHALGFFSTFNSDLIRKVDLYKGNIPAEFGGRLVSVMDVEMREGDFEQFRAKAGIGPISSKIALEGPIIKDKVSLMTGFRSSYTDWLLQRLNNPELERSSAFFLDGNVQLTAKPSDAHTFVLSGYYSEDDFGYNQEFGFDYSTRIASLKHRWLLNDKMINQLSLVAGGYNSSQIDFDGIDGARIENNIEYLKAKNNIKIIPSDGFEINAGVSAIQYYVDPGIRFPEGDQSVIPFVAIDQEKGRESAAFGDLTLDLTDAIQINGGLRFSYFQFLGPHEEWQYANPEAPTNAGRENTILKDGTLATYSNLEPRASMRLKLGETASVKLGYSRTAQYINQIFNTDSPTPSSQWQLSTRYIKPQLSHNVSIGAFKNFNDNKWETSFEVYARRIDQLFDYIDFATILVNDHLETDLLPGIGRAYGAELSIKKNTGIITGWLAYTLSRAERQVEGINGGSWYLSNFDKTHDASLILNYNPNRRNTFTMNVTYNTGRPITAPLGSIITPNNIEIPIYSQRNSTRIPDYYRVDVSYTLGQSYNKEKNFRMSWTLSVYNVLGRKNPYNIFFTRAAFSQVQANRLAIIGAAFPSLTVNFEFD